MHWSDLSHAAKIVLEWLEGPVTGKQHLVAIRVGERPRVDERHVRELVEPVSEGLFQEISTYLGSSEGREMHFMIGCGEISISLNPFEMNDGLEAEPGMSA